MMEGADNYRRGVGVMLLNREGKVFVDPTPNPPGTYVEPACFKPKEEGVV